MAKKSSQTNKEVQEPEKKPNGIKVQALWKSFSPDCRPYKPSTPQIEFPEPLVIVVNVPLTSDLVLNGSVIAAAQLSNQAIPKPQFTPLGMRYIIDQFESAMKNGEPEQKEETAKADDEDWGDAPTEKELSSDDEEWSDEDQSSKDKEEEDAPWKEDWEE